MHPDYDYQNGTVYFPQYDQQTLYENYLQIQRIQIFQATYQNFINQYSDHLLGGYLQTISEPHFLSEYLTIFYNLLNALPPQNLWGLINTPLTHNIHPHIMAVLSDSKRHKISNDTKPIVFIATAGDVGLLAKIDDYFGESAYKLRLENGYNLLHCLVKNPHLSSEYISQCIDFLLEKNINMLTGIDDEGHTPAQLCAQILATHYQLHYETTQSLKKIQTDLTRVNPKEKSFYKKKQVDSDLQLKFLDQIANRIEMLKLCNAILQFKLVCLPKPKPQLNKNRQFLQTTVVNYIQQHTSPQEDYFKEKRVNPLAQASLIVSEGHIEDEPLTSEEEPTKEYIVSSFALSNLTKTTECVQQEPIIPRHTIYRDGAVHNLAKSSPGKL